MLVLVLVVLRVLRLRRCWLHGCLIWMLRHSPVRAPVVVLACAQQPCMSEM